MKNFIQMYIDLLQCKKPTISSNRVLRKYWFTNIAYYVLQAIWKFQYENTFLKIFAN